MNWLFTFQTWPRSPRPGAVHGCVALINFAILYWLMHAQDDQARNSRHDPALVKVGDSVRIARRDLLGWNPLADGRVGPAGICSESHVAGLTIGAAAVAFFGSAMLFRIEEIDDVFGVVRRKVGRRLGMTPKG
jgi:hypothetical protein